MALKQLALSKLTQKDAETKQKAFRTKNSETSRVPLVRLAMRSLERQAEGQTERHTDRSPNPAAHRYRVVQIRPEATTFKSNSDGEAKEKQILWSKATAPQCCPSRLLQKQMPNLQPCAEGSKVLCALFLKTFILIRSRSTNVHCKTRQHRHLQLETTLSFFVNSLGRV